MNFKVKICIFIFVLNTFNLSGQKKRFDKSSYIIIDKQFSHFVKKYINAYYKNIDSAAYYSYQIEKIALQTKLPVHLITSNYIKSKICFLKGENKLSITYLLKALKLAKQTNNKKYIVNCYNSIGIVYKAMEKYNMALTNYLKALELVENPTTKSEILNNIANIFSHLKKYNEAILYQKESLKLADNDTKRTISYINIGLNFLEIKQNDSAKYYIDKGQKLNEKQKNLTLKSNLLLAYADYYVKTDSFKKAVYFYKKSINLQKQIGLESDLLPSFVGVINSYLSLNKPDSANLYIKKYYRLFNGNTSKNALKNLKLAQANFFYKNGKYKKAYIFLNEYIKIKDSLLDNKLQSRLAELKAKFDIEKKEKEISILKANEYKKKLEFEKKEKEILILKIKNDLQKKELEKSKLLAKNKQNKIEILNKEQELQKLNIENKKKLLQKNKKIQYIILLGSLLLLIPLTVLLFLYKFKIRSQKLITIQKDKINRQRIKEIEKNKQLTGLKSKLTGQEIERKRIAKELHDGLGGSLASIKIRLSNYFKNKKTDTEIKNIIQSIDATCEEIRTISHDLTPVNIANENFIQIIKSYIYTIAEAENWEIDFEFFPEDKINNLNKNLKLELYRIIQEIITNAKKYSKTKKLDFQLILHDDYLNLLIEDFGVGFNQNEPSSGLGINNIRERVMILKGVSIIDSVKNRGTIFNIKIPI